MLPNTPNTNCWCRLFLHVIICHSLWLQSCYASADIIELFQTSGRKLCDICLGPWLVFRVMHRRADTEREITLREAPACISETEQRGETSWIMHAVARPQHCTCRSPNRDWPFTKYVWQLSKVITLQILTLTIQMPGGFAEAVPYCFWFSMSLSINHRAPSRL